MVMEWDHLLVLQLLDGLVLQGDNPGVYRLRSTQLEKKETDFFCNWFKFTMHHLASRQVLQFKGLL